MKNEKKYFEDLKPLDPKIMAEVKQRGYVFYKDAAKKETNKMKSVNVNFDLDLSTQYYELYFDSGESSDPSYLKDVLRFAVAKENIDPFWQREFIIKESSAGLYAVYMHLSCESVDVPKNGVDVEWLRKKILKAIVDKDHKILDLKITEQ